MGLISAASGRETSTMIAVGSSSKIREGSDRKEKEDDIVGSDCIWKLRDPLPDVINFSVSVSILNFWITNNHLKVGSFPSMRMALQGCLWLVFGSKKFGRNRE